MLDESPPILYLYYNHRHSISLFETDGEYRDDDDLRSSSLSSYKSYHIRIQITGDFNHFSTTSFHVPSGFDYQSFHCWISLHGCCGLFHVMV
jgi:hypothetical protein